MCSLKVGPHEVAVAQRGRQALVTEEPPHLIEPRAVAQPGGCREVAKGVRMQPAMMGQAGPRAQAVEDLHEVAVLEPSGHGDR